MGIIGGSRERKRILRMRTTLPPLDEIAYQQLLSLLQEGGMDAILKKVGKYLEWETQAVYQASFLGYSFAAASEVLLPSITISEVVIPFILPPSGAPEVLGGGFSYTQFYVLVSRATWITIPPAYLLVSIST